MPKLGEQKKSVTSVLCSEVAYELEHRQQLQAQPTLSHALSETRTPRLLGEGQERDGMKLILGATAPSV